MFYTHTIYWERVIWAFFPQMIIRVQSTLALFARDFNSWIIDLMDQNSFFGLIMAHWLNADRADTCFYVNKEIKNP